MDAETDVGFPPLLFSDSNRPPAGLSINYFSKLKNVKLVKDIVDEEIWQYVKDSPVGVIAKFLELNFNLRSMIVHGNLLCNQLACKNQDELWFLIAGKPARFSLLEFEDITGLNCGLERGSDPDLNEKAALFFKRFSLSGHTGPSRKKIEKLCIESRNEIVGWDRDDKIRLCYLAILSDCLLAEYKAKPISFDHACLAVSLPDFEAYPWGRVCFQFLCNAVKSVTRKWTRGRPFSGSYSLKGFVQVLQVYAFVHVPRVGQSLGQPIASADPELPPILRFRGISQIPKMFHTAFQEVSVLCMSTRSARGNKPSGDDRIDNLVKYINEGKRVSDIVWTIPEKKPVMEKKRKNEKHTEAERKKRKMEEEEIHGHSEDNDVEDRLCKGFVPSIAPPDNLFIRYMRNITAETVERLLESRAKFLKTYAGVGFDDESTQIKNTEISTLDLPVQAVMQKQMSIDPTRSHHQNVVRPAQLLPMSDVSCAEDIIREETDKSQADGGRTSADPTPSAGTSEAYTMTSRGKYERKLIEHPEDLQEELFCPTPNEDVNQMSIDPTRSHHQNVVRSAQQQRKSDVSCGEDIIRKETDKTQADGGRTSAETTPSAGTSETNTMTFLGKYGRILIEHPEDLQEELLCPTPDEDGTTILPDANDYGVADPLIVTTADDIEFRGACRSDTQPHVFPNVSGEFPKVGDRMQDASNLEADDRDTGNSKDSVASVNMETVHGPRERKNTGNGGRGKATDTNSDSDDGSICVVQPAPGYADVFEARKRERNKAKARRAILEYDNGFKIKNQAQGCPCLSVEARRNIVFGEVDDSRSSALDEFLKNGDLGFLTVLTGSHQTPSGFFEKFLEQGGWLLDTQIDLVLNLFRLRLKTNPRMFVSDRIAVMSTEFNQSWTATYDQWKKNKALPGGSGDYVTGKLPNYARGMKKWNSEVSHLYGVLNVSGNHWVGYVISVPDRAMTIYDSLTHNEIPNNEAAGVLAELVPGVLNVVDASNNNDTTPYRIILKDPSNGVPRMTQPVGDCGVYALKFIECLMLGIPLEPNYICNSNMHKWRRKYAADIVAEIRLHTED